MGFKYVFSTQGGIVPLNFLVGKVWTVISQPDRIRHLGDEREVGRWASLHPYG